jgi:hypothetical protein
VDLLNARGWTAGTAEITVGVDTLAIEFDGRTLAVMVRDGFQAWLTSPVGPYETDDVVWSTEGRAVWLTVDGRACYCLPDEAVDVLGSRL